MPTILDPNQEVPYIRAVVTVRLLMRDSPATRLRRRRDRLCREAIWKSLAVS
jgi:hypothetical protein